MTPSKKNVPDTKSRILEAALDLFSERGFYATTTRKIAQKAGVNEVTLFRHFSNKINLFHEVLDEIKINGFDADKVVSGLETQPEDAIRFAVEMVFEIFENRPRQIRLLINALLGGVEGFEEDYVVKQREIAIKFISNAFAKLQDQNKITSKEAPDLLAQMLFSQTLEMASQRAIIKSSPLRHYDRETICKSILKLYLP